MSSTTPHRREDVNPQRGEKEYGDVAFADPVNKKYPVDTPEHVRAAWSYDPSEVPDVDEWLEACRALNPAA